MIRIALLVATAFAAGAVNSVAGGGTLLTFPALLSAGVPPIAANATSTVALVPGSFGAFWGYRSELGDRRVEMLWLGIPSVLGGLIGAIFLLRTGDAMFSRLVPWLILGATGLFVAQGPVRRWALPLGGDAEGNPPWWRLAGVAGFQFLVALYGGYFGAGIGILMLAALGILGQKSIHRANALKNFANVCINAVASFTFILQDRVVWGIALAMAAGAIAGGYLGAGVARRIGQQVVRKIVVGVGLGIGVWMLIKQYG